MPAPVPMSATLAADAELARRRAGGERVLSMASGEIGLPVLPALAAQLAAAADHSAYGSVAGSSVLREAAAGYWGRRGLDVDPELVVAGPGSKPLLFALLLAIGGDVVVPVPSWVSYQAQARLAGAEPIPVPIRPGEGGVPDPSRLREAVIAARAAGRDPRCVIVTVPDNPTGTIASPGTMGELASVARELDLVVVSDEIYCDLVYDGPAVSPALLAPERTVVTTGLTKNLAVGGWRTGVARVPDRALLQRLVSVASQVWSSPPAPVQAAAAYALAEPPEIVERVAAGRHLHETVARAVAELFVKAGATLAPVRATCYLYPDFSPLREHLLGAHGVHGGGDLAQLLSRRGVGLLPASAFGESVDPLRIRAATSRLYGDTDAQRLAALEAADPLRLPWVRDAVEWLGEILSDLTQTR
ncbi:pyridoxal phosphate-dependent aminotransferase [Kutzneria sp. 744]|uniref:pyridoxal phosphate-dependent aminotransferase n=1 Tax=Kutzneria sp. (strain 744) TaxID=345341 RepID=UPI0003EEC763|nr:pyridoxal phosphate-dependent aminotransferase [Kutzneria sp. 744]EWM17296.1 aminotransferase [Kutzneria sp. 744]